MGVLGYLHGQGISHKVIEEAAKLAIVQGAITIIVETLAPAKADENYLRIYNFYTFLNLRTSYKYKTRKL